MPKATDVNGVEWGKSELTISGLAALGGANMLTNGGKFLARTDEEMKNDKEARDQLVKLREKDGSGGTEMMSALYTQSMSKLAGTVFGVELDVDTVLARQGGRVLNPNAEMLFQGPVIRDFSFEYQMIARSEREGREIRKIIRFLKLGMAPKFQNIGFLANPDVFTLEYKNGPGKGDILKTANKYGEVIVGLLTDEAIASYKNIPHLNFNRRKIIIKNIKYHFWYKFFWMLIWSIIITRMCNHNF